MDVNYHSNQINQRGGRVLPIFTSGTLRQRGAGIGSLVAGISSFVIPLARKYVVPVGRDFIRSAVPEILDVVSGKTKPKKALKRAAVNTAKKQLGSGKKRRTTKTSSTSSRRGKKTTSKRSTPVKKNKKKSTQKAKRRGTTSRSKRSTSKASGRRRNSAATSKRKLKSDIFSSVNTFGY